jgi:hypothetical protein
VPVTPGAMVTTNPVGLFGPGDRGSNNAGDKAHQDDPEDSNHGIFPRLPGSRG